MVLGREVCLCTLNSVNHPATAFIENLLCARYCADFFQGMQREDRKKNAKQSHWGNMPGAPS
jgi:hypothetical protein